MGREIRRVPHDFDEPLNRTWRGYVMPDDIDAGVCPGCEGDGHSARAKALLRLWYGDEPYRDRSAWMYHVDADDVAALLASGRLRHLTHYRTGSVRWEPIDPPVIPTPDEVNAWSRSQGIYGHDSISAFAVVKARCEREGVPLACGACDGSGQSWRDGDHKAAYDAWEQTEPPTGEGWQMWQTVSDGPISPVFETADGLIEWMTTPAARWGAMGPWTHQQASLFVLGCGWAPTFIASSGGLQDGVTAAASGTP